MSTFSAVLNGSPLGIAVVTVLTALLVRLFWMKVLRTLTSKTRTTLDDFLLRPTRELATGVVLLFGAFLCLSRLGPIKGNPNALLISEKALEISGLLLFLRFFFRIVNIIVDWHGNRFPENTKKDNSLIQRSGFFRKSLIFMAIVGGVLGIMRIIGFDIGPFLAGGAIGGLAVALALQDTLGNIFAGFHLSIDQPIRVGDFVRLESGEEGFVEEIGWRNTRIRMWANNIVIIPNSKLSQSIIVNYCLPTTEMAVYVSCGISYASDLHHVEKIAVSVGKQVAGEVEGASKEWEPVVRWKEFGNSAITFTIILRVVDFASQFALQSEYIKALHSRFKQEKIEIPFPIQTVILKNGE